MTEHHRQGLLFVELTRKIVGCQEQIVLRGFGVAVTLHRFGLFEASLEVGQAEVLIQVLPIFAGEALLLGAEVL